METETSTLGDSPSDAVNHPKHYVGHPSGIEAVDLCEYLPFNVGNALKYVWRAGQKGDRYEDLRKAEWYLMRQIAFESRWRRSLLRNLLARTGLIGNPTTWSFFGIESMVDRVLRVRQSTLIREVLSAIESHKLDVALHLVREELGRPSA